MAPARTLVDILHRAGDPPAGGLTLVGSTRIGGAGDQTLSCADLTLRARAAAAVLRRSGCCPGSRVVVACARPLDVLTAFWGSLVAGAIPALVLAPPHHGSASQASARLAAVAHSLGAAVVVADDPAHVVEPVGEAKIVVPAELLSSDLLDLPELDPSAPALVQFSSGSTGTPRGVVLSHSNILANVRGIAGALALTGRDVGVSWMPLHHDMGLIGFHPHRRGWNAALRWPDPAAGDRARHRRQSRDPHP
jgi:acyl-CoA synthetase (AMP-forming)/AMP-acid ligase II